MGKKGGVGVTQIEDQEAITNAVLEFIHPGAEDESVAAEHDLDQHTYALVCARWERDKGRRAATTKEERVFSFMTPTSTRPLKRKDRPMDEVRPTSIRPTAYDSKVFWPARKQCTNW